jgi:hypothetical protein
LHLSLLLLAIVAQAYQPSTESTSFIRKIDGYLTESSSLSRQEVVNHYIQKFPELFNISELKPNENVRITRDAYSPESDAHTLWFQQIVHGIPVYESQVRATVKQDGRLVTIGSTTILNADQFATTATPQFNSSAALRLAYQALKINFSYQTPKEMGLIYFPVTPQNLRLSYKFYLFAPPTNHLFEIIIDAQNGNILLNRDISQSHDPLLPPQTASQRPQEERGAFSYEVFTNDSPRPWLGAGPNQMTIEVPEEVSRKIVSIRSLNSIASPNGWVDERIGPPFFTIGNNVNAASDHNFDLVADLPRTQTMNRKFSFNLDLSQDLFEYADASVTQVFYVANWFHDRAYGLGFTETFGNFQTNNFHRGGVGGDPMLMLTQINAAGHNNNAFFSSTPEDGVPAYVILWLFDGPSPRRDSGLDNQVLVHELTHGLTMRMLGSIPFEYQAQGMSEGWSDFYAMTLLSQPEDPLDGNYPWASYISYQFAQPWNRMSYYFGWRRYPYSTNVLANPLSYADIDDAQFNPNPNVIGNPVSLFGAAFAEEPHNIGEVWAVSLWEMRSELIRAHGWAGNEIALRLVTNALKYTPPNSTMVEGRDAILIADQLMFRGQNRCAIWRSFSHRGLGVNASSAHSILVTGIVENFQMPQSCS